VNLLRDRRPLSWRSVAEGMQHDPALRAQLTAAIRDSPHPACFFETVPVSRSTADQPFEFATVDSRALATISADPSPFRQKFSPGQPIARFPNRGRDAVLVSPNPALTTARAGAHIADFVRHGQPAAIDALWQVVGAAVADWWRDKPSPVWVSTSGLGVHWLHVRLDTRPKYYTHAPFRAWPR